MIDVALTAAGVRPAAVAVVIDVLRATTTITQALAGGYERVLCTTTRDQALELRASGRVIAGEKDCVPPAGFDLGNSPSAVETATGRELVLSTSNGTPAIVASAGLAEVTLLGCLANLDALVELLRARGEADDVLLVCSGTNGRLAVEDVYVAGRIVVRLGGARSDAAEVCALVAAAAPEAHKILRESTNGQLLVEVGLEDDIAWCARESTLALVPRVSSVTGEIAVIAATELAGLLGE
ncbi:MAG: 2-phosphosulfolactate phosphatase [Solirubrobacteraceae bacterium]|jgi:2-phosphosulfolactate phosphatase|nr:2-phosphosulfolactate phosphatase [Solirubrobacteraceae bacterium]